MGERILKMATSHILVTAAVVLGTVLSVNYVLYRVRQRPRYPRGLTQQSAAGRVRISVGALEDLVFMAASGAQLGRVSAVRIVPDGSSFALEIEGKVLTSGNRLQVRQEMEQLVRRALRDYAGNLLEDIAVDIGLTFS